MSSAFEFDDHVILEEFVRGRELELAVMGNEEVAVSRAGEIIASREFYDFEDKYLLGKAETIAPTDLSPSQLAHARRLAEAAYRALRVEGLARVDVFLLEDDEIVVNEVNTMPGFTPISMFPMLWEAEGRSFGDVIEDLVGLARARHDRRAGCAPTAWPDAALTTAPPDRRSGLSVRPAHPAFCSARRWATMGAGPTGASARTPSVPC